MRNCCMLLDIFHCQKRQNKKTEAVLSSKDQRDIEKRIEELRQDLLNNPQRLMLSGNAISEEAIESLIEALSHSIK